MQASKSSTRTEIIGSLIMKYFITTKEGPMIKNLGLSDSDTKYINIIDSLVAEMDENEIKDIERKDLLLKKREIILSHSLFFLLICKMLIIIQTLN